MNNYIKKMLNGYEEAFGEEKELNDLAIEDLKSGEEFHPGKPLILHAAYGLDGHTKRRGIYDGNYELFLSPKDKKAINQEIVELAEMSALLHDPSAILEESSSPSEQHALAREVLEHLAEIHEGQQPEEEVVQEMLINPLVEHLLDRVFDRGSILYGRLHPTMVKQTEHTPEAYGHLFNHTILQGMMHQSRKKNWQQGLKKLFTKMKSG